MPRIPQKHPPRDTYITTGHLDPVPQSVSTQHTRGCCIYLAGPRMRRRTRVCGVDLVRRGPTSTESQHFKSQNNDSTCDCNPASQHLNHDHNTTIPNFAGEKVSGCSAKRPRFPLHSQSQRRSYRSTKVHDATAAIPRAPLFNGNNASLRMPLCSALLLPSKPTSTCGK